jgi:hypothetical protein
MTQLTALLLSIASESVAAWTLVAAWSWGNPWRAALAAVLGTLATHWAAWWTMLWLMESLNYGIALVIVETAVVLVESLGYRLIALSSWTRALLASLIANITSTMFGLTLYVLDLV